MIRHHLGDLGAHPIQQSGNLVQPTEVGSQYLVCGTSGSEPTNVNSWVFLNLNAVLHLFMIFLNSILPNVVREHKSNYYTFDFWKKKL